jgi:hypothetical protein
VTQGEKPMEVNNPCPEEWNPGTWPYAAKCVLGEDHKGKCVDRRGRERPDELPYLGPSPIVGSWMMGHE